MHSILRDETIILYSYFSNKLKIREYIYVCVCVKCIIKSFLMSDINILSIYNKNLPSLK
jgi:hypothetical protein